jgi:hypothetical protein
MRQLNDLLGDKARDWRARKTADAYASGDGRLVE